MYLLTLEEWITSVLVRALGWTFAHSIWQALLLLLIAHIVLAVMKKAKASARYTLLLGISLLFIGVVVTTFLYQLRQSEVIQQTATYNSSLQRILYSENSSATPVILESKRILDVVLHFFNDRLHVFVALWFIIFCVKWLRLSLHLTYVKRISRYESVPVGNDWQHVINKLKSRLEIKKRVELLYSNIVKVPLVSGVFRPLIIVPAGMLSNMPADVIESILLHELAHIKRNDYLVNVIQSGVETIFFFNPFILKLSSLIREEREACCDAVAIECTDNKVSYVQALVTFGEYSSTSAPLLAFAGSKNHLLQRVKRILYNQNKKPGFMEKSILLGSVLMFTVITAFTSITSEKKPVAPVLGDVRTIIIDTVPDNVNENVNENENTNGDQPSRAENRKRKKQMRDNEVKMEKKQKELEEIQEKIARIQLQIDNNIQLKNEKLQKQLVEIETKINLQNEKLQEQQELQMAQVEKAMKDIDMEKINRDVEKAMKDIDMDKINRDVEKAMKDIDMEKINKDMQAVTLRAMEQKKMFDGLTVTSGYKSDDVSSILEFLDENNVADKNSIKSFKLNYDELIVNDKKQSSSLHEQLKERYIKNRDDQFIYHNSNGSKTITITRNDPS